MRFVLIYFICFLNCLTSNSQTTDDQNTGKVIYSLRGYTYWEKLQVRATTSCQISALDSNTFTKIHKIRKVSAYHYTDSNLKYLADVWMYNQLGYLTTHQTKFSQVKYTWRDGQVHTKDTLYPTFTEEFKYNNKGYLTCIDSKSVALLEPYRNESCEFAQPDSVVLVYHDTGLLKSSSQIKGALVCKEVFSSYKKELIEQVDYYVNEIYSNSIVFEYSFW